MELTDRNSSISLNCYLKEVAKIPLLSPNQEVDIAKIITNNNSTEREIKEAKDDLVKHNLRYVITVAKRFTNDTQVLTDLINEGNYGLIRASNEFDHTRGYKFISYAVNWIKRYMYDFVNQNSKTIRLPVHIISHIQKMNKYINDYELTNGSTPPLEVVIENNPDLFNTQKEIDNVKNSFQMGVDSYDNMIYDEEGKSVSVLDKIKIEEENNSYPFKIKDLFRGLNEFEVKIISLKFGIGVDYPMGYVAMSKNLKININTIKKRESKIFKKMRQNAIVSYV